jgi:hypothetical protein
MTDQELSVRDWAGLRVLVVAPTPTEPLDFGNRKRIFHVCAELKARGASVHYVHYASESDWRRNPPLRASRVMQETWDALYTVPVTRPLHPSPKGRYHTIDEWWDPAIGDMLTWLFATQSFDMLIVNYTWLSKALEYAPSGVLKVLDTHDRFSGRRELLEANGLTPEYFYTTDDQEAIALRRADVVWAIKAHEEEHFRLLTPSLVVTVPYVEPIRPLGRTPMPNGIVRFGMVGARNNINLANIRAFISVARHYVERTLLPCEFVIAGSCCDDLRHDRLPPFVRLIGRQPDLTQFYQNVDVVLAPMTFSTGLKIKVGEALSLGKALIAHEHAFEGYERAHDFHTLPSFEACLWACKQVVANPELIEEMEIASVRSAMVSARQVGQSLDETLGLYRTLQPGACIVLDAAELRSGSLVLDHACEVGRYLGWQGNVYVVLGGSLRDPVDNDAIYRVRQLGEVVALPKLHAASAPELQTLLGQQRVRRRSYDELAQEGHPALWFTGALPADEGLPPRCKLPAFISLDGFALSRPVAEFPAAAASLADRLSVLHVLSRDDGFAASAARSHPRVCHHRVPLFFNGHQAYAIWALERAERRGVLILAEQVEDPLLKLLRQEVESAGIVSIDLVLPGSTQGGAVEGIAGYMRDVWAQRRAPAFVVDLSRGQTHDAAREAFQRAALPVLRLFRDMPPRRVAAWAESLEVPGVFSSLRQLRMALHDGGTVTESARRCLADSSMVNDPGWAVVWDTMVQYRNGIEIV